MFYNLCIQFIATRRKNDIFIAIISQLDEFPLQMNFFVLIDATIDSNLI